MSVVLYTDKGTFKGRKVESCIRTNFGEKCRYAENPDAEYQGEILDQNDDIVATVTRIEERQPYVAPPSRSARWFGAIEKMQDAVSIAEEVQDEKNEFENGDSDDTDEDEFDEYAAQQKLDEATSKWSDGVSELNELKDEYQEWHDNLPEAFQYDSPVGEKLQTIIDMDFEEVEFTLESIDSDIDEGVGYISEYEDVDLPLGFGRD